MSHGSSRPFSRKHSLDASLSDSREASTSLPAESGSMLVNIPRTTDVMAVVGIEIVRERRWRATVPAVLQYRGNCSQEEGCEGERAAARVGGVGNAGHGASPTAGKREGIFF